MKNQLTFLSFCFLMLFAIAANANTYYVSPTGSDSNPGTIDKPFKTWQKLSSVLKAGDVGYIRGGTYTTTLSPGAGDWLCTWENLNGTSASHIVITNYPGESPVFDFNGFLQANNTTGLRMNNCAFVDVTGIRIINLLQNTNGNTIAGVEFHDCHDITLTNCSVDNIGGAGWRQSVKNGTDVSGCNNFTYINCDASRCADPISTGGGAYGNADGFDANGVTTYINCRAWWNSDDGFDCFGNDSHCYYRGCWSFRNGYKPGTFNDPGSQADGMGFKWGSTSTDQSANILRTYTNCIAFNNKAWGFDQNVARCKAEFYNNTSYNNKSGGWATGYGISPREQSIFKNNISFSDPVTVSDMSSLVNDHNTWNSLAATTASFASLDTTGVSRPRQSDGSLPAVQFLHLAAASNLINAGVSVANLQFSGSAPDLGAFEYAGNQSPVANAGSDQIFFLPDNSTTLIGSGTDADGTISSYQWSKVSGPTQYTLSSPTLVKTNLSNLVEGVYQFELKVTDNSGAVGKDTVTITVNQSANQSPIADAGNSQSITVPANSVSVDGSNSTDPDGTIVSYQWTKILGPSSSVIANANLASTNITNLVQGVYQYELKVTDNLGAIGKDTVQIAVGGAPNQPPVADAGLDINVTLPTNNVTLSGSGSDPDGTVASDQWSKISGPSQYTIASPGQAQTSVNNLVQGTYAFELKVTDNAGASDRDTVKIVVNPPPVPNQPPIANAGSDITITLPTNNVTLSGSGSDGDGTVTSYQWNKISGSSYYNIASPMNAQTSVINLVQGTYQFQLTVTDDAGATATDVMQVTVNAAPNQPPVADAGADIVITLPTNSVTLSGSGSDGDGTVASYRWNKISGPSQYNIVSSTQAQTTVNNLVQGTYQFQLTVTDDAGAAVTDVIQVTVNAAPNQPPVADAGADIVITLPTNSVTLSGSGNDPDGSISSYQWSKISGPAQYTIAFPSRTRTSIDGLTEGVYEFQLQVTDNSGAVATDIVQVTVNGATPQPNQNPTANAGPDLSITLPTNNVTLNGNASDPDGNIAAYQWSMISGPSQYDIVSATQARTSVTNLAEGVYQFALEVTDNSGATDVDVVQITVNAAPPPPNQSPTADAGADIVITLPTNSATLSGGGTDPDGTIASYQWNKTSGPSQYNIVSPNTAQTSIDGLVQGVYTFELTVTDNAGATNKDNVQILVNAAPNQSPSVNAGSDIVLTLPTNSTILSGSATDPDGTIASYQWNKTSGPSQYNIASPNTAQTSIDGLVQGVYTFELTVTDNAGATNKDNVQIIVNAAPNQSPSVNAGSDIVLTLPTNSTALSGSGTDPDGWLASYQWRKISGPSQYNIASPNSAQTSVNGLVLGVYAFECSATDNSGAIARDTVQIFVNAAPNQSPVANAGADINITLPTNSVSLSGNGTDPDGTIATYRWTKISGPTQYTIVSSTVAKTSVTNLVQGTYNFALTVTDNSGATAKDTVVVTVNAAVAKPNQIPEANAGRDVQITLPTNSARLSGSGADPDGSIVSYRWRSISGPNGFTINSSTRASTTVSNLVQGVYNFELTVTDNAGASDKDTVVVTVLAAPPNQAPKANAGADINITLPTNSTTLSGSGSDPDGTIASYKWAKVSGPSQYNINSSTKAQASANNLVTGVYQFELTVTDNAGKSAKDTVKVTVSAAAVAPNQAPTANAGLDINVTLPTNSINLLGSGSDVDGTIASYQWKKISGPSQYTIVSSNQAHTAVNNLAEGTYQFELTVTDNSGKSAKDTVQAIVNPASLSANHVPTADAGSNMEITLPTNSVKLSGKGSDVDGTISSYKWKKSSGPAQYTIASSDKAETEVSDLVQGVYQFELTVTDNKNGAGTSSVEVTVHAAPNQAPTANAGSDLQISLPVDTATLNGTGSTDPDGTIASYQWAKISGPTQSTVASPSKSQTLVSNLAEGVYQFELTVTDNAGASSKDTVELIVLAVPKSFAKLFPNPATSVINIQIEGATKTSSTALRIYDNKGILVYQEDFVRPPQPMIKQVDVSRLPGGIYFIELQTETSSITTLRFFKR